MRGLRPALPVGERGSTAIVREPSPGRWPRQLGHTTPVGRDRLRPAWAPRHPYAVRLEIDHHQPLRRSHQQIDQALDDDDLVSARSDAVRRFSGPQRRLVTLGDLFRCPHGHTTNRFARRQTEREGPLLPDRVTPVAHDGAQFALEERQKGLCVDALGPASRGDSSFLDEPIPGLLDHSLGDGSLQVQRGEHQMGSRTGQPAQACLGHGPLGRSGQSDRLAVQCLGVITLDEHVVLVGQLGHRAFGRQLHGMGERVLVAQQRLGLGPAFFAPPRPPRSASW